MGKIIQIKVPTEIFKSKLLKYLIAEELTKDVKVSEEEISDIDEEVKESVWKELKRK